MKDATLVATPKGAEYTAASPYRPMRMYRHPLLIAFLKFLPYLIFGFCWYLFLGLSPGAGSSRES